MATVINVSPPFPVFTDATGEPVQDGSIYVGVANSNPLISSNQIAVYLDSALTIPIAQPIITNGGYPMINGAPTKLYIGSADYSIIILDKTGSLVFSSLSNKTKLGLIDLSTDVTGLLSSTFLKFDPTTIENSALVVVVNTNVPSHLFTGTVIPDRYGTNTTPGTTPMQTALDAAKAVSQASGCPIQLLASTYLGTLSLRYNNAGIFGPGTSVCTLKNPAGALSPGGVLELGDTASGNSAAAYTGFTAYGFTIDGNRANATAPTDDLRGHGLTMTKITNFNVDLRMINCHNTGFGAFIDSNYGFANVYVENCGNATHTGPGMDLNSSKYNIINFISKGCQDGGRVLDNCYGNQVTGTVLNPLRNGFIYNNQSVNESYGNTINVVVEGSVSNGWSIGPNCRDSIINATVKGSGDTGLNIPLQAITTKTFDGSSAAIVVTATDTITVAAHGWSTASRVMYSPTTGTAIGGLTGGVIYWVINVDANHLKLASSSANANAGVAVDLTAVGTGVTHTLTENLRPVGNTITVNTQGSANSAMVLGGDSNIVTINTNKDGRAGAQGSSYAVDVSGNQNTLSVNLIDSETWQVRGIAVRAGATDNVIASYEYTNTQDPLSDLGTRTKFNPGGGLGAAIASAATINIPVIGTVFHVTGAVGITAMSSASAAPRVITLIFDSNPVVTDGGNLKLTANFNTTVDDTLTGFWDGTNFYEMSRSAN